MPESKPVEARNERVVREECAPVEAPSGLAPVGIVPVPLVTDAVPLRRLAAGDDPLGGQAAPPGVLDVLRRRSGGGAPLPEPVRSRMGEQFGADLSGVRIHNDGEAHEVAAAVQSVAFTHGRDVYFSRGSFDPGSGSGQRLLAHELAHVTSGERGRSGQTTIGRADDPAERAADATADRVMGALRRSVAPGGTAPADGIAEGSTNAAPAALRRTAADGEPATLRRVSWPKRPKWLGGSDDPEPTNEQRTPNPLRTVNGKQVERGAGAHEDDDSRGRRKVLGAQSDDRPNLIKITTAGSGYGKWATTKAKAPAAHKEFTQQLKREGLPDPEAWVQGSDPGNTLWYRKNGNPNSPEFLFAGPGGAGSTGGVLPSASDTGSNKITAVVSEALRVFDRTMNEKKWRAPDTAVLIRAHSRGSVAGALLAKELRSRYHMLDVEVTLFDPVAGPNKKDEFTGQDLSEMSESTVVYSIRSSYGRSTVAAFKPMLLTGVKRIIISAQNHSAGLVHGFRFGGSIYKGSRLNNLPAGLYVDRTRPNGTARDRDRRPLERYVVINDQTLEQAIAAAKRATTVEEGDLGRPTRIRAAVRGMQGFQPDDTPGVWSRMTTQMRNVVPGNLFG